MRALKQLRGWAIKGYLDLHLYRSQGLWPDLFARSSKGRVTAYFQADDPYSVLLADVLPALAARYQVAVELVVVPPPDREFEPEPALHRDYALADARLLARYYTVSFPSDPVRPSPGLVARANAVLLRSRPAGDQLAAAGAVGRALWAGDERAIADLETDLGAVSDHEVTPQLRANYRALCGHGHYRGGMLHYGGAWYWGVDRLGYLEARLRREVGLASTESDLVRMRPVSERPRVKAPGTELACYLSLRSPYSYIGLERTLRVVASTGVPLVLKPVLPMVMRGLSVPALKRLRIAHDARREADHYHVPLGRVCDPVGPGVERCMAIMPYAMEVDKTAAFMQSAYRAAWAQGLDLADDGDLEVAVIRAGLDWGRAQACLDDPSWRDLAERNQAELAALGMWGVPCFRFGDNIVWGQDRLPIIEDMLRQALL